MRPSINAMVHSAAGSVAAVFIDQMENNLERVMVSAVYAAGTVF